MKEPKLLLKSYALEHDFYPVQVYVDDGFSGTKFDRPDFQRMIQDIENGTVGTVIVKDMSRLGRNHITVGYYTEEFFLKHKIRFRRQEQACMRAENQARE